MAANRPSSAPPPRCDRAISYLPHYAKKLCSWTKIVDFIQFGLSKQGVTYSTSGDYARFWRVSKCCAKRLFGRQDIGLGVWMTNWNCLEHNWTQSERRFGNKTVFFEVFTPRAWSLFSWFYDVVDWFKIDTTRLFEALIQCSGFNSKCEEPT